jgi:hypothetical protein
MIEHAPARRPIQLPSTWQGCQDRLAALRDEIASIRIQVAVADIHRQTDKGSMDATHFHRVKTDLRLKRQEVAQLIAHLAKLRRTGPVGHRERFKDALIEVLRADCDEAHWQSALSRARALQAQQGVEHG